MTMSKAECNLPINGILLVNKPQGLSSNAVLQKVKRLYKAKKAGHTGSLDPLATGMLPVCFGEATKICQYLLDADKHYEATGLLGIKTSTGDSLGEIIKQTDDFTVSESQLLTVINQFVGLTQQVPSMFSALKHQGKPLYKLAREGITIDRKARDIVIEAIKLLRFDERLFEISVSCSKGTYIRNLVEDIGEKLGVYAHVTQLHRVHTTGFKDEPMYSLDELTSKSPGELLNCLLPLEKAIDYMPLLRIKDEEVVQLRQGKTLQYEHEQAVSCIRLRDSMDNFIGLGQVTKEGVLKVKRLLATE
jgi:tRNA pseudouridine55 synthase